MEPAVIGRPVARARTPDASELHGPGKLFLRADVARLQSVAGPAVKATEVRDQIIEPGTVESRHRGPGRGSQFGDLVSGEQSPASIDSLKLHVVGALISHEAVDLLAVPELHLDLLVSLGDFRIGFPEVAFKLAQRAARPHRREIGPDQTASATDVAGVAIGVSEEELLACRGVALRCGLASGRGLRAIEGH